MRAAEVMHTRSRCSRRVPLRERRSRLASVRRSAARAPRATSLLRPGPYRTGWLVVLLPAFVLLVGARTAPALPRSSLPATFDGSQALSATDDFVRRFSDRSPGSQRGRRRRRVGGGAPALLRRHGDAPALPRAGRQRAHRRDDERARRRQRQRALERRARLHRGPRRPAARAGGQRQRLRHRRPRGARATLVGSVTQTSLVFASVDGRRPTRPCARSPASRHPPGGLHLSAGVSLRAIGVEGNPLILRLAGEGHRLPAAGWLRTVEQGGAARA